MFFIPTFLYGQETFRDEYTLKGTTVLIGSDRIALSDYVYGYRLSEITSSECQSSGRSEEIKEEILNIYKTDSSYIISVNIRGNCAHAFLGEIEIVKDSIINLIASSVEICEDHSNSVNARSESNCNNLLSFDSFSLLAKLTFKSGKCFMNI